MSPEIKFFDNPKDLQKRDSVLGWLEQHSQSEVVEKFLDINTLKSAVIDNVNGEPVVILYERHRTRVLLSEKIAEELKLAGLVTSAEIKSNS